MIAPLFYLRGQSDRRVKPMRRVPFPVVLLTSFQLLASGCVYLQNGAKLKTATDAADKFATFQKSSADTYQTMLANQQKLEDAFEQDFERQSSLHAQALAIAVPDYTWPDICHQLESFTDEFVKIRA